MQVFNLLKLYHHSTSSSLEFFACESGANYGQIIDSSLVAWKLTLLSFFLRGSFVLKYPISPIKVIFFTVHSFYEKVRSNPSNAHDHKLPSQQGQTFFFNAFPFFYARLFTLALYAHTPLSLFNIISFLVDVFRATLFIYFSNTDDVR